MFAAKFIFDLNYSEYDYLFLPSASGGADGDGKLNGRATAKQVATHIRLFANSKYGVK